MCTHEGLRIRVLVVLAAQNLISILSAVEPRALRHLHGDIYDKSSIHRITEDTPAENLFFSCPSFLRLSSASENTGRGIRDLFHWHHQNSWTDLVPPCTLPPITYDRFFSELDKNHALRNPSYNIFYTHNLKLLFIRMPNVLNTAPFCELNDIIGKHKYLFCRRTRHLNTVQPIQQRRNSPLLQTLWPSWRHYTQVNQVGTLCWADSLGGNVGLCSKTDRSGLGARTQWHSEQLNCWWDCGCSRVSL